METKKEIKIQKNLHENNKRTEEKTENQRTKLKTNSNTKRKTRFISVAIQLRAARWF